MIVVAAPFQISDGLIASAGRCQLTKNASANGSAERQAAPLSSSFVLTAIEVSAIAAACARGKSGALNGVPQAVGTNEVPRAGSTTVTDSARTGSASQRQAIGQFWNA
jgi:hypothetical protein